MIAEKTFKREMEVKGIEVACDKCGKTVEGVYSTIRLVEGKLRRNGPCNLWDGLDGWLTIEVATRNKPKSEECFDLCPECAKGWKAF